MCLDTMTIDTGSPFPSGEMITVTWSGTSVVWVPSVTEMEAG